MHWWNALSEAVRTELACFHALGDETSAMVDNINTELFEREMRLVTAHGIQNFDGLEFPNQDYYENLIGHDVYLCARGPTFHICKAHKDLRLHLLLGILPRKFSCYVGNVDCTMTRHFSDSGGGLWRLNFMDKF